MKKKSQALETVVHGAFLLLGLITVGCVLLISVYLIVSGIPAIRQIGLIPFLFGKTWASTAAEPSYGILPFILTSVYGTAGATLTVALYVYAKEQGQFDVAFAIAAILMLLTLLINGAAMLVERYFRRKRSL